MIRSKGLGPKPRVRAMLFALLLALPGWGSAEDGAPAVATATSDDWTQWRGPGRDGQAGGAWPDSLAEDRLRPIWRVELGPGFGGPLLAGDRVFTVETKDKHFEVVRALDRATGEQLWGARWEGAIEVPAIGKGQGDWIKATPAYDEGSLYVVGMEDVLVCLNTEDGSIRWRVDFKEKFGTKQPEFGSVSSPLVDGDWVFVQAAGRLVRLEKKTGVVNWHGLDTGDAAELAPFSSPVIATIAGRRQLVAFFPKRMGAIDPETCELLWDLPVETAIGAAYPTPVVVGDGIFLSLYGRKTVLYRVTAKPGGGFDVTEAWTNPAKGYMSTPVVVGRNAYVQLTNRRVVCIDLDTGTETWGTAERFGLYWGMTANGDKILALDGDGTLRLLRANPVQFEVLDTRKVSEVAAWAPIAFADGELYVRDIEGLTRYAWE